MKLLGREEIEKIQGKSRAHSLLTVGDYEKVLKLQLEQDKKRVSVSRIEKVLTQHFDTGGSAEDILGMARAVHLDIISGKEDL